MTGKPASRARRSDPDRRQRIVDAALDVIAEHGVAGTTHRRVAAAADVPLGSMTYYFTGLDDLLHQAFDQLARQASAEFLACLHRAETRRAAIEAVVDIIAGNVWSTPRTLLLSYELYAYAARHPGLQTVMRGWMEQSRAALGRHFDPLTCRALDALVEGIGIHNSVDATPLNRAEVETVVRRIAG